MVYITNYNFKRITKKFDVPKQNFRFDDTVIWIGPDGTTYGQNNPTRLFAPWDIKDLLMFKAFCKDTELAAGTFYHVVPKPQDSYRYIQPEKAPAYHEDPDCIRLHSEFERILIPEEIRVQGPEKINEFRRYWNDHEDLRLRDSEAFVAHVNLVFKTNIRGFEVEVLGNSGIRSIDNISIRSLNEEIYQKLHRLFSWAKEDNKRKEIFINFAYLSYIVKSPEKHINYNPTNFSEIIRKTWICSMHYVLLNTNMFDNN